MRDEKGQPKNLSEIKYEELEQYDIFDEELMQKKEKMYASYIGAFLIWFSDLEHSLDIETANLISDREHMTGYLVIKNMEISEKIELFYSLAMPIISYTSTKRKQMTSLLTSIRKRFTNLVILRNKIAHAKWYSLDDQGYVRVDMKTYSDTGNIKFRKFKITPTVMRVGIKDIERLGEDLFEFSERVWS